MGVALTVALTVALVSTSASGAFTGSTANGGNSVASAGDFCTAPGTVTLTSDGDSWVNEAAGNDNHVNDLQVYVRSSSAGDRRTWIRFVLPTRPTGCVLSGATLNFYARTPTAGRWIDVYRGDPAGPQWTSSSITWATQPAHIGTAVGHSTGSSAGWVNWNVLDHVRAQYTNGNNGFVLRDRTENSPGAVDQLYDDRQNGATSPSLVLTWS